MAQSGSWWGRNWKWLVPLGCVSPLVICGGCISVVVGILFGVFGVIKSSEPYQEAMARARANPAVLAALGEPITEGFFIQGNINLSIVNGQETGTANLAIPISGPKGTATLRVAATKAGGKWNYHLLNAELGEANQTIDLLGEAKE